MKVTVEHCETGHIAVVEVLADTGATVRLLVENAWPRWDNVPDQAARVELEVNGRRVHTYTSTVTS